MQKGVKVLSSCLHVQAFDSKRYIELLHPHMCVADEFKNLLASHQPRRRGMYWFQAASKFRLLTVWLALLMCQGVPVFDKHRHFFCSQ